MKAVLPEGSCFSRSAFGLISVRGRTDRYRSGTRRPPGVTCAKVRHFGALKYDTVEHSGALIDRGDSASVAACGGLHETESSDSRESSETESSD